MGNLLFPDRPCRIMGKHGKQRRQSLTLLEGAPAPGRAAVYLLTPEELDRNPRLPGLESLLRHPPAARNARVCKAEVRRDCLSGTVVIPRQGREGERGGFGNLLTRDRAVLCDDRTAREIRRQRMC